MTRTGYRHTGRELRLTERQREVLDLIARGRTNPEIASDLGISLDGAKWHVSEVLSRLNVATREEAAERWRAYNRTPARFARLGGGMVGFLSGRSWLSATLGVGVAGLALLLVLVIVDGSGPDPAVVSPTEPVVAGPTETATPDVAIPPGECPVDPELCAFALEREALLQVRDFLPFLTPSPYQRADDIASFTSWLDGTLPFFDGWKPVVVSIGCPVYGDLAEASCAEAFALAFSTLDQAAPGVPAGIGEFLYRRESQDGTGQPELRGNARPSAADIAVVLAGGTTVSTRDFQVRDLVFPEAARITWFPLDASLPPPLPPPTPLAVTGLFTEPQPSPTPRTANVVIGESPFPPDEGGAAIYDTLTERVISLGPGQVPLFSPDGTRAAFVTSDGLVQGDVTLVDLATGVTRVVGRGRPVYWLDDQTVAVVGAGADPNSWTHFNIETGMSSPAASQENEAFAWGPGRDVPYELQELERVGELLQRGGNSLTRWLVARDGVPLLTFEAYWVVPQSDTSVVVATEPDLATLATNLFSVDIQTGAATFLASAVASSPNWPLSAFGTKVMWTDRYCPIIDEQTNVVIAPTGDTWLFDSATGVLTRILGDELPYPVLISETQFSLGEFGRHALISLDTFAADVVLPAAAEAWTADYRYAATGFVAGHGGLC